MFTHRDGAHGFHALPKISGLVANRNFDRFQPRFCPGITHRNPPSIGAHEYLN